MPRTGGGRRRSGSGSGPDYGHLPLALRRILLQQEQQRLSTSSSVEGDSSGECISGSKSKASEGTSKCVPRGVSPSSSSESGSGSECECECESECECGSGSGSDGDLNFYSEAFQAYPEGQLIAALSEAALKDCLIVGECCCCSRRPLVLHFSVSGGGHCYLLDSVNNIWAKFADYLKSLWVVSQRGFLSLEDKSSAINADTGVDKRLVDLINDWRLPGMKLCVGKPEYKVIIESKLKIPCMYCQTVMEIMWGIQYQMRKLVYQEKLELTKEDRLPMSQGLKKFLSRNGFDVKPEMVNEKIVAAAGVLFDCDATDKRNLFFLREAGLHIRDISGISCESWDMLKLAIAVKVICCPDEELTDFHEVLAEDELTKLKGDALKYSGITGRSNWLRTCNEAVSTYQLRIAKKKLIGSLVKEAYEAEEKHVRSVSCRESPEQIPQDHVVLANRCNNSGLPPRPPSFPATPSASNLSTCLAGDPSMCLSGDEGTTRKRRPAPLGLLQWTIEMLGSLVKRPRRL